MRQTQSLGNLAVQRDGSQQDAQRLRGEANGLNPQAPHGLRGAGALDELPGPLDVEPGGDERRADGRIVGELPAHDYHGYSEPPRELMNVDYVEAADGDALDEHGAYVVGELRMLDQLAHALGGVFSIALNPARHHTVKASACTDHSNQSHRLHGIPDKGPVIE